MNIGGHIAVARRLCDDPVFWLGAALPDLGSVGGFRLVGTTPNDTIAAGIRCHHATDDAFHRSDWFRSRQDRLRSALAAGGMARGPARAVAHVGPELLIDGTLTNTTDLGIDIQHTLATIPTVRDQLAHLVSKERDAWLEHVSAAARRRPPNDFDDPAAVARRLHAILARRPRLTMPEHHIQLAARCLANEHASIARTAPQLVESIADQLI